jgi:hypothetical protein
LESTFLEFCGTYFGSQRGSLDVLFTAPSIDYLILVFDDDDYDDDDKDGGVQPNVDVGGSSQIFDENIPSEVDLLIVEVTMETLSDC